MGWTCGGRRCLFSNFYLLLILYSLFLLRDMLLEQELHLAGRGLSILMNLIIIAVTQVDSWGVWHVAAIVILFLLHLPMIAIVCDGLAHYVALVEVVLDLAGLFDLLAGSVTLLFVLLRLIVQS